MHRPVLRWASILVLASSACTGLITGGSSGGGGDDTGDDEASGSAAVAAREKFDKHVLPLLDSNCKGCHVGDDGQGWMKATPDAYTTIMGWPNLVSIISPESSRLLTKGMHQGPAWTPEQAATVLSWLSLERDAHQGPDSAKTEAMAVAEGQNMMPLDNAGAAGSMLTFTAQRLTLGLYLSNITVTAGTGGVHLTHPLFVTWKGSTPSPDPVDSFDTVDMDLEQGTSGSVGGGLLLLQDIPADAKLSVTFKKIGKATGAGGGGLAGCKAVASFTTNARGQLSTSCVSCHGGANPGATNAVDMTKVNDTSAAGQMAACGQALGRMNLANTDMSGMFIAADPASGTNHPFKFQAGAFTTYKNALSTWIAAEKAAP